MLTNPSWLRRQFTRDAELIHDIHHGVRLLKRSPGFAALAVLVLALGVGATVGIFSVIDTLLVRPLPYRDADRVVLLWQGSTIDVNVREDVSPANFLDWRDQLQSFEAALAFGRMMRTFLYGITPADPLTLGASMGALAVVALAACVVPARRATRVDPLAALRAE